MSILSVVERFEASFKFRYEDNQPFPSQTLERNFWVTSTSKNENPDLVRTASGVPTYGSAHPTLTSAIAQDFDLVRDTKLPTRWEVRVTYESRRLKGSNNSDPSNANQDPTLITQIRVSTVQGERVIDQDQNGFAPQLTSSELFVCKVPWNELQMELTQYRSVLDTSAYKQLATYRNAINSDVWRGFPPYTAHIASMQGQEEQIGQTTYLKRVITVQLRSPDDSQQPDWRPRYLNAGYYFLPLDWKIGIGLGFNPIGFLKPLTDPQTDHMYTKPQRISEDGSRILSPAEPDYYVIVPVYPELPFAALNI